MKWVVNIGGICNRSKESEKSWKSEKRYCGASRTIFMQQYLTAADNMQTEGSPPTALAVLYTHSN
jgi:hypothetical protein